MYSESHRRDISFNYHIVFGGEEKEFSLMMKRNCKSTSSQNDRVDQSLELPSSRFLLLAFSLI